MGQLSFPLHLQYLHPLTWNVQLWKAGDLINRKSILSMAEESTKTLCNTYTWNKDRMGMEGQTPRGDSLFNDKPLTPELGLTSSLTHSSSSMPINSPCFLLIWLALKQAYALKKAHIDFWLGQNVPLFQDLLTIVWSAVFTSCLHLWILSIPHALTAILSHLKIFLTLL